MSLSAFEIPRERVQLNPGCPVGKEFFLDVRGLSAADFAVLVNEQETVMRWLFEGANLDDQAEMMNQLAVRSTGFLALVVALAAGEPEFAFKIALLPIPTQIQLATTVARLTMPEGLKKSLDQIRMAISPLLNEFKSLSANGEQAKESKKNKH
ncbi:phage pre-tape measure protein [Pseudomonas guariconensis]|uniref:phage pre-tape measure protein n=1 Tax=Pseudomonas guariconensis TaxID=1288410 RepID=UPI0018AC3EFF|nr:hypothetical protein [Pseudomonas guariconensis]MBF8755518.1 hypothetical protein [Pseudomonas guariconensis]